MNFLIMSQGIQLAQPLSYSDDDDALVCLTATAGKRPRPSFLPLTPPSEDQDEGEDLMPLLADFFCDFHCSVADQISICRTYASHLAACQKTLKKAKK